MANQASNSNAQARQQQARQQYLSAQAVRDMLLQLPGGGANGATPLYKGVAAQAAIEDAWEAQAFAEDLHSSSGTAHQWPPRSYACTFCAREFRTAQALGGHMNVHRKERAQANQLAMLRQAATFTQLAAIGPPRTEQLQPPGGPLACVITRPTQPVEPTMPTMSRVGLSVSAANDKAFPILDLQPGGGDAGAAGAASQCLERASSPAQSTSNSPMSSPRPSQCSSTSSDRRKSRKRSYQIASAAAPKTCGDHDIVKPNAIDASFMQILQPSRADGSAGVHARSLVLPLRAFRPYSHSTAVEDLIGNGGGLKRASMGSGDWVWGCSDPDPDKCIGDADCEDSGLDLELRL